MTENGNIIDMKVINNKEEIIISNDLSRKISRKKYSLQFLPACLDTIKDKKTIDFKGKKIKTSYLIDIVNGLILKYYFKKDNKYVLNATILKDRYGYLYNYYINYLVESNILIMVNNYKKGFSSRIYSLNSKIFKSKISRYKNEDKVLIKKYKKKIFDTIDIADNESNLIDISVKKKLISDLFDVNINMERSIFFLDNIKDRDIDMYNRNLYSVDCINNKHIFYHFDNFGRMHTNYTILKSYIRKNCLLINGEETCEMDISNSQPLFLAKLINDSGSNWIDKDEFKIFKELTINGKYYEYLKQILNISDRREVKEMTYKVLFGRNSSNSKADKNFKSIFPTIHRFIQLYKKENGDYKVLAYKLQKMESDLIFNKIIKRIIINNPEIKVITVHDSIVVPIKFRDEANTIFQTELIKEFNF